MEFTQGFSIHLVYLCVLLILELPSPTAQRLNGLTTVNDYMDLCLVGRHQKTAPGPEPKLLKEICSPWANRSCCTPETAAGMRVNRRWLNFDWDHCKNLSPRCREHFLMDLCFYECSPNVGPWLVEDRRKIRSERFKHVPLCQSVCNNWWGACKDDFTCLTNWAVGFNWSTGINTCPIGSPCRPFHEMYSGANDFCQNIMGGSFQVVPDEEDCFVLWFDPQYQNPNEAVARKAASKILGVPYQAVGGNGFEKAVPESFMIYSISVLVLNIAVSVL